MYVKELIKLHNVRPIGILHVGAHLAEENSEYRLISTITAAALFGSKQYQKLQKR